VEKLAGDVGETVTLKNVLLVASEEEFLMDSFSCRSPGHWTDFTPGQGQEDFGI